jgi:SAM-dependent methyltransferase
MNDVNRHRPPAWHLLAGKQLPFSHEYHEKPRTEIMPLLPDLATCILDVGCGTGVAARMLGERYRGARLYGVEIQPEAAAIARERLAKVSDHDLQSGPFPDAFLPHGEVDLVLMLDVLKNICHPWRVLQNLRPALSDDASLIISIPNARCLAFLDAIAGRSFEYAPNGPFDATHIRPFTLDNVRSMLNETGYTLVDWMPIEYPPSLMPPIVSRSWQHVETRNLTVKHGKVDGFNELFAGQWLQRAQPGSGEVRRPRARADA